MELSEGLNFALLRVRIASHTDRPLAAAAASARVGLGTLAPGGKTFPVANAPVAVHLLEALEICLEHSAKITLDHNAFCTDNVSQLCQLLIREFPSAGVWIDPSQLQNALTCHRTNAVNIGKRCFDTLLIGDVDAK